MGGLFAPFFSRGGFATFSLRGGPFCYVFLLMWGLFHNVGAFFAIIFSMWGDFFYLHGGFYVFIGFFMGLPLPPTIYFADACYYATFIPYSPPSLTAAIMYPTKPTATPVFNLKQQGNNLKQYIYINIFFYICIWHRSASYPHIFLYSQLISKIDIFWSNVDDFTVFFMIQNNSDFDICSLIWDSDIMLNNKFISVYRSSCICRTLTQTYCKILLSMCVAMCMCILCNIYVALGARGLNINTTKFQVDRLPVMQSKNRVIKKTTI